jgi:hypothetical protein
VTLVIKRSTVDDEKKFEQSGHGATENKLQSLVTGSLEVAPSHMKDNTNLKTKIPETQTKISI